MNEEYREIIGYEGLYSISNLGNVKSRYKQKKLSINKDSYYVVTLSKNSKSKTFNVHRLVALQFIPNPDNLPQVNHKDENKLNNCISNLEWCTQEHNMFYGTVRERISKSQRNNPSKCRAILQYTKDDHFIQEWHSACEVQRELGFSQSNIVKCCKGKFKTSNGYIWKYKANN